MKIERIEVKNFLGLRHLAIDVDAPVLLVCGPNGAGKSSLIEAIRFALTGETPRAALKKDFPTLLSAGQTAGIVSLTADGQQIVRNVKTGAGTGAPGDLGALAYTLDAPRLARMDAKERRAALFGLMGVSFSAAVVAQELIDRGHMANHVERIKPYLKSGFDAAAAEAKKIAAEARGGWKEVTGETYGAVKAETWSPAPQLSVPAVDPGLDYEKLRDAYDAAVAYVSALEERKAAAERVAIKAHALRGRADKADALRADLARIDSARAEEIEARKLDARNSIASLRAELDSAIARLAEIEARKLAADQAVERIRNLKVRAAGVEQLRADLAKAEAAYRPKQTPLGDCPECGAALAQENGALVVAIDEPTAIESVEDIDALRQALRDAESAQSALDEIGEPGKQEAPADEEIDSARESVAELRRKMTLAEDDYRAASEEAATISGESDALRRALRDAEDAQTTLDDLVRDAVAPPTDDEIMAARRAAGEARDIIDKAEILFRAADEAKRVADADAKRVERAQALHGLVVAWSALEAALSPSGLPAELLARALGPLNAALERVHQASEWPLVQVADDISITAGGRAYGLLSESEKWRADAALAYAAAFVSGCGLVLLDRFDVLDVPARSQFIRLALAMDAQTIAAGTLKESPGSMPGKLQPVWLGD